MLHTVSSSHACKHWNRLEKLARYKHSSLLRKFVNRGQKSFTTYGRGVAFSQLITNIILSQNSSRMFKVLFVRLRHYFIENDRKAIVRRFANAIPLVDIHNTT